MKSKIFCYIEFQDEKPSYSSLSLLNYANLTLRNHFRENFSVIALVLSENNISDDSRAILYSYGADSIFNIIGQNFATYNLYSQVIALKNMIKIENPEIILFSSTPYQREIAPYFATMIGSGLTADCTGLEIEIDNELNKPILLATRPTFGGKLMAQIGYKGYPQLATIKEGLVSPSNTYYSEYKEYKKMSFDLNNLYHIKTLETILPAIIEPILTVNSNIIIGAGFGIGSTLNFNKLSNIVNSLKNKGVNIALGASRKAVESGFAPKSLQIGQTGSFISCNTYIMLGISGAIHHMIATEGVKKIIAVNNDQKSPISTQCDTFICDDVNNFIDKLLKKFAS